MFIVEKIAGMKVKQSIKTIARLTSVSLLLFFLAFNVSQASAATGAAPSSTGISINPRKNLLLNPGQTVHDNLVINNLSQNSSLNITIRIIDFTYFNQTGTPKLMLAANAPQTAWSLKPFMSVPASVVIPPGTTHLVPYTVKIPPNQGAGSYYSAIEYSATSGSGGNVNLNASGVTLVFVTVSGTDHENLALQKFGAYQPSVNKVGGEYTFIATNKPEEMAFTLKNNGNVAEAPSGSIDLNYMFGGKPIVISNININSALALLQQSRLFTTCIAPIKNSVIIAGTTTIDNTCGTSKLKPGHYSATISAYYGQNGNRTQEVVGTASFWYLPWWLIGFILGIIVVVAFFVWRIQRKIRQHNFSSSRRRR
jgi:hypothetical protein